MSKKFKVTDDTFKGVGLGEFYKNVATLLGHTETETTMYDCREINVANNIQEAWFEYYRTEHNAEDYEIAMILLCNGAKVDENLADNEVEVFDGFITD